MATVTILKKSTSQAPVDSAPFRQSRFCPRIGFDGRLINMSRVAIRTGKPWSGAGVIEVEAMMGSEVVEFAKLSGPLDLTIGIYHSTDKYEADVEPSCCLYLGGIAPINADMKITELDVAGNGIMEIMMTMKYDRLTFIFGNCPLEKMAAAVS